MYSNAKSICLICNANVALPKKGNLEQHFKTVHKSYDTNFPAKSLLDLAFLTDLTDKLNNLNLELQGKEKHVMNMISSVNTFKSKLHLLSSSCNSVICGTFHTWTQNLSVRAKTVRSLRVHVMMSKCRASCQNLTGALLTLHPLSLLLVISVFHLGKI